MKWSNILLLTFLGILTIGCSRYDYPRGIHQSEKSQQSSKLNTSFYIVQKGDTLYSIGKRYHTDFQMLARRNGIKKPYIVYVGQRIYIQGDVSATKPVAKTAAKLKNRKKPAKVAVNHPVASQGSVQLLWPAKGRLSSKFGPRKNRMHDGIDIAAEEGTVILAAAAGKVVYADSRLSGYGNLIILRHSKDMFTAYAHNKENMVKRGDKVQAGQQIALMGSTGRVSESRLHFEVRRGETAVDPLAYLPRQ